MLFVNNHAILHSRQNFEDSEDEIRYLQRLWLRNAELAWSLPAVMADGNERMRKYDKYRERWNLQVDPNITFSHNDRLGQ